ncbi:hypothetical protein K438DRAFT_2008120 [Mycena galopus ATCC 62051]|nr:hypothetical protein K438DRAFT_2008120 [Mycena galopus ATCC 62051]
MRRYSAGTGRLLAQPVRWNYTPARWNSTESSPKSAQEPVDPPAPAAAAPTATRPNGYFAPRRFPQLRVDDGTPYTPNLDAMAANATPSTLSGRLAARLAAFAAEKPAEDSALPNTELGAAQPDETADVSQPRSFPTTVFSQGKYAPTSYAPPPTTPTESADDSVRRRHELLQSRRAERLARQAREGEVTARAPQSRPAARTQTPGDSATSQHGQSTYVARGGMVPQTGRGGASMRGTRGSTRGDRGRGRGRGGGGARGERRTNRRETEDNDDFMSEIDDWLEMDEAPPATARAPELPTSSLHWELRPRTPASKPANRSMLRENLGGDYSRFVPQNPQLFLASPRKIGPVTHSCVILAHTKQGGTLENRTLTQEVVAKVKV